ncbi:MAG: EamA family transporter [Kiloniellales bacterium]
MSLEPTVLLLVLLAAVLHATWNAFVKSGEDKLVLLALVIFSGSVPAFFLLPFLPLPATESWPFLVVSVVVHLIYYAALVGAYRHGDLSQVYPIARGSAPFLVAIGAWIFAGEGLGTLEWAGVATVSIGIMSLASPDRLGPREGEVKAVAFAFLTGLTIAIYALADGMGVRRSGAEFAYIAWLFVLSGVPILLFTLWLRRGRIAAAFRPHLKAGIFGGLIAALAYGIAIWAMSIAPIALVVSVRETSVLIAAAIGSLFLKESFGRRRIVAAAIIVAGAALLNLGG